VEILYFTIAGIALYFAADFLLDWVERRRGTRFENRSLIFFAILLALALIAFQVIGRMVPP
jgi:predicted PurR-regulated permease PerM